MLQCALERNALRLGVPRGEAAVSTDHERVLVTVDDHQGRGIRGVQRLRDIGDPRVQPVELHDAEHLVRHVVELLEAVAHRHARSIGRIGAGQASKPLARQDDLDDVAADLVGDGLGQFA